MRAFISCALLCLLALPASAKSEKIASDTLPPLELPTCEHPHEGAVHAIACYRDEREKINQYLDNILQDIYTNYTSPLGADADKEFKEKIKAAQSGWEKYKSNHCFFNYNSKASTHPPSVSINMIKCELLMTYDRIKEIRITYRNF